MYQTIIVPINGSSRSESAIPVGVALARASGAALDLVRVYVHDRPDLEGDPSWDEMFRATVTADLSRLAASTGTALGRTVNSALLDAPVVPSLCTFIAGRPTPLVVLATHARIGVERALVGSVADGLMRHGELPVLMLRDADDGRASPMWRRGGGPFRVIVVPLDGTALAEAAIAHAVTVARLTKARLHFVRVVGPALPGSALGAGFGAFPLPPGDVMSAESNLAGVYLDAVAARVNAGGGMLDITTEVLLSDRIAPAIVATCRRERADLVVMASHGRGASRLLMRAVADTVLHDAVEALLLVHPVAVTLPAGLKSAPEHVTKPAAVARPPVIVV